MLYGVVHYHKNRETFTVLNITADVEAAQRLAFSYASKNLTKEERIASIKDEGSLHPTNYTMCEFSVIRVNKNTDVISYYPYVYAVIVLPEPEDFNKGLKDIDKSLLYKPTENDDIISDVDLDDVDL